MTGSVHLIKNKTGVELALTHYPAHPDSGGQQNHPVILAHGTFSNHRSVRGIAQHLTEYGFDCWILDFQGHGHSGEPKVTPSFESMCLDDSEAVISHLQKLYPSAKINWVGHSGGGLAPLMYLARNPDHHRAFNAVVTLASQATDAANSVRNRFAIVLSRAITALLGVAPGKYLNLGPENEFASVMSQWYGWSLSKKWQGSDGFDYIESLPDIRVPCLMLAGHDDRFIAPTTGCELLFNQLGSTDKEFRICGTDTGFIENYNHARLVSSRSAANDIWPLVSSWLLSRQPPQH